MILHVRGLEPLLEVQAQHRSSCASCIGATLRSSGENNVLGLGLSQMAKKPVSKKLKACQLSLYLQGSHPNWNPHRWLFSSQYPFGGCFEGRDTNFNHFWITGNPTKLEPELCRKQALIPK